jgi:hypothetical protein
MLNNIMRLQEITLSHPPQLQWTQKSYHSTIAEFEVPPETYFVSFKMLDFRHTLCCRIDYGLAAHSAENLNLVATLPTNLGRPLPVLATVQEVVKQYIIERHPDIILFYDVDNLSSRKRIYNRFANWLEDRFGYELDTPAPEDGGCVWVLRLPPLSSVQ